MYLYYRFRRTLVGAALCAVLLVCSSCSNILIRPFPTENAPPSYSPSDGEEDIEGEEETEAETEKESQKELEQETEEVVEKPLKYQYVDFSGIDWDEILPVQVKGSLLGKPGYCYSLLSEEERRLYEEIYYASLKIGEYCLLSSTDVDQIKKVHTYMDADHPELFWSGGYHLQSTTKGDKVISIEIRAETAMTKEQISAYQKQVRRVVSNCHENLRYKSSFEKVRYIYEYLVMNTTYDLEAENNQNILSVFLNQASVCQGYSEAAQYLLLLEGIPAITVSGSTLDLNSHAWNLMKLNGHYTYMDTTWGDPEFTDNLSLPEGFVDYDYLCLNDEELSLNHISDGRIELPKCEGQDYNYYVQEGLMFDSWDPERFVEIAREALEQSQNFISIRFASNEIKEQAMDKLLNKDGLIEYMNVAAQESGSEVGSQFTYYENPNLLTVKFMW